MKTICFLVPSFPNISETFVVNQILATQESGFKVIVLTKNYLSLTNSSQKDLLEKHNITNKVMVLSSGIPKQAIKRFFLNLIYLLKYSNYIYKIKNISFYNRFFIYPFKLNYYKQFKEVAVFHAQFADATFDVPLLKSVGFLKGKLITTFHGYDAHFRDENKREKLAIKHQSSLKYSDYVTVNTAYIEQKVIALGCESTKLKVIPMGINIDFFTPKNKNQKQNNATPLCLMSVGRLIELKGHKYAIKAVKLLTDWGYAVKYTIIGFGELHYELNKLVIDLELESVVELAGSKSQQELKSFYENHDVYLMCSVTDSRGRAEAQGLATIEAQAMGLPVVAFNSGGVPYTIENYKTGFLVQDKNVEAFAKAIANFIDDTTLLKNMSITAQAFAGKKFSLNDTSKSFLQLYDAL